MGAISPLTHIITEKFKCKSERLISGLMTVNVRHDTDTDTTPESEIDCNYAYHKYWDDNGGSYGDGLTKPNDVPNDGDYPYYKGTGTHAEKPDYNTGFQDSRRVRDIDGNYIDKQLSLGDSDTYLFFVSAGFHGQSAYWAYGTVKDSTDTYYSKPMNHDACQSFVKYDLISRINNSAGAEGADGVDFYDYMWKRGQEKRESTFSSSAGRDATDSTSYIQSNGIFTYPGFGMRLGSQGFNEVDHWDGTGTDQSSADNHNDFFTPVFDIQIYAEHTSTPSTIRHSEINPHYDASNPAYNDNNYTWFSGSSHTTSEWNLNVDILHWVYTNQSSAEETYFRNRVNVFWQPFGETSELELP